VLTDDLTKAGRHFEELGFVVLPGGRHPGRGTANLIIPFGHQYLELLAVVDQSEAQSSPQGRPVLTAWNERGPGLARWSVEAADIEATARRVGLPVEFRQRTRPDGVTVSWQAVGVDLAWSEPWRCAFMAWDDPRTHPARSAISHPRGGAHPNGATGIETLEVEVADRAEVLDWLGGAVPSAVVLKAGRTPGRLTGHVESRSGPIAL
jgi:hypothetical protein